jgi:hypothetical protein
LLFFAVKALASYGAGPFPYVARRVVDAKRVGGKTAHRG